MSARKLVQGFVGVLAIWVVFAPASAFGFLPDGRVYEQVSPADKNGNDVGGPGHHFGLAAANGEAVVFKGTGAMGESFSSKPNGLYVAKHSSAGWSTTAALLGTLAKDPFGGILTFVPSADFSRYLITSFEPFVSAEPTNALSSTNIFLSTNPSTEPLWLAQPTIANPVPVPGANNEAHNYIVAGATPDLSTIYFTYSGTLIPEDSTRAPYVGNGRGAAPDPWGLYEWHEGVLREAGVLPDGTVNPFGAVPAALAGRSGGERDEGQQAQSVDNEVSSDGSRILFVSPDPSSASSEVPELYLRVTSSTGAHSTMLVSQSQLPGHTGERAPTGPMSVPNTPIDNGKPVGDTDGYMSPDGSRVFFASTDRLTAAAPEDNTPKEYEFTVDTGALTYLPGVVGPIVLADESGSSFLFENRLAGEVDLWQTDSNGGTVTQVAQLPPAPEVGRPDFGVVDVSAGRVSSGGSVYLFRTNSPVPGGFNNEGGFEQLYRYSVSNASLNCVSCPPRPTLPSGEVRLSYDDDNDGAEQQNGTNGEAASTMDTRGLNSDGSQVFFDTPDALVPQDVNGQRDVYEWENGTAYLLSSGSSPEPSFFLDSSESGDDAFFTTSTGLVKGDADGAPDLYDARVPRPGDSLPPSAVPCQGDVCQGPPSVPSLLGAPSSASFNGLGNVESQPEVASKTATSKKATGKKQSAKKKNRAKKGKKKKGSKKARKSTGRTSNGKRRGK